MVQFFSSTPRRAWAGVDARMRRGWGRRQVVTVRLAAVPWTARQGGLLAVDEEEEEEKEDEDEAACASWLRCGVADAYMTCLATGWHQVELRPDGTACQQIEHTVAGRRRVA